MHKVLLLGTSRLHRPFARRVNGEVQRNYLAEISPVFSRMGYVHTSAEAVQKVRFCKDVSSIPSALLPYVFRIEPRPTTPDNEFDLGFEAAIRSGSPATPPLSLDGLAAAIIEVSSLTVNREVQSGCLLHTNPNILKNVPYADIYPEGYYKKFEPALNVERCELTCEEVTQQIMELSRQLPGVAILVMTHLRSESHPNAQRQKIHEVVASATEAAGVNYFDNAPFLEKFGFAQADDKLDPHHLSLDGEVAIGRALQERVLEVLP